MKEFYRTQVRQIKQIFEQIDEDNNGYLTPYELTLVSSKLGSPMDKDQIE